MLSTYGQPNKISLAPIVESVSIRQQWTLTIFQSLRRQQSCLSWSTMQSHLNACNKRLTSASWYVQTATECEVTSDSKTPTNPR